MNIKPKVIKGSLFFIVTLLLLYFTQVIWFNYCIKKPLMRELKSVYGVEKVAIQNNYKLKEPIKINIHFAKVSKFYKTYKEVDEKIINLLGQKPYNISVFDNRTAELEELYYNIHYYIEKALIDGDYPMLNEKSSEIAKTINAETQIFVDGNYIYIQLSKNDSFLYKLIPRH